MTMRTLGLAALAATPLLLAGCVQMHTEVVVDERGGGSGTITMSMSESVAEAAAEMQKLDPDSGPGGSMPMFEDVDREMIERRVQDYGVEITSFEKSMVDGRETLAIAYDFDDLRGMSAMMEAIMSGGDGDENGLGIFDAGDGNLVLRPTSYDLPTWDDPEPAPDEEPAEEPGETAPADMDPAAMEKQMELMGKLMGAMAELDISMSITVPGDIVSTTAPQQEGRTSIWVINSENMMTAGQDMEPEIVFSGEGVKIEPLQE